MPIITLTTQIAAPREVVFDLSRSVELHVESTAGTGERAVDGRLCGLLGPGEWVTWEATHLFIRQRLTSQITQYDRPVSFRDSMVQGAFRRFDHDHLFEGDDRVTVMRDVFDYTSPLGPIGRLVDSLFLKHYMVGLLRARNDLIRVVAESGDTDRFLKD